MGTLKILVNDRWIEPRAPYGSPALDFIRGEMGLTGTKEGCREGDCGACAVLVGEFAGEGAGAAKGGEGSGGAVEGFGGGSGGAPRYMAVPSCLLALGDLAGKHVVTIEGLGSSSPDRLTPVMRAFLEENASQCGFCSPGFIIALSAWLAAPGKPDLTGAMIAVDGNLCRCTGYGAIRRAAERLAGEFADLPEDGGARLGILVERGVLPRSTLEFMEKGRREAGEARRKAADEVPIVLGGGTDYFVRNPDPGADFRPLLLRSLGDLAGIAPATIEGSPWVRIGAATIVRDFFASTHIREAAPGIENFERDFASTLIRNVATVGGNIANASPVGDITAMLMALGAVLEIGSPNADAAKPRSLPIEEFFKGYKQTALEGDEIIQAILLPGAGIPDSPPETREKNSRILFSFEKIAKRKNLDIAAVNTAISFRIADGGIHGARISAGGVAAVPMLLRKASALMENFPIADRDPKALAALARAVSAAAEEEVSPIGDVRGSSAYRKRMTGRLVLAHFIRLFGNTGIAKELFP